MRLYTFRRIAIFLGIGAFGIALANLISPLSDALGAEDGVQFLLASLIFVISARTSGKLFTERPFNFALFFSMAASLISASFMLSSAWAIGWRALDYSPLVGDSYLRFTFRWLAVWGCVSFLVGSELFDRSQDEINRRIVRLSVILMCVALTVFVVVWGWRLEKSAHHDTSSPPPSVEDQ